MKTDTTIYLLSLVSIAAVTWIGIISLRRRKKTGAISLMVFALHVLLWSLAYLGLAGGLLPDMELSVIAFIQFCMLIAVSAQFSFSLICAYHFVLRSPHIIFMSIMPALTLICFGIELWLHLYRLNRPAWIIVGEEVFSIYACVLSGASMLLLWVVFFNVPWPYQKQIWALPVISVLSVIAQVVDIQKYYQLPFVASLPAFVMLAGSFGYEFVYQGFADAACFTRQQIMDTMTAGLMVINRQNIIVDINSTMERLIGQPGRRTVGKSISSVIGSLPYLDNPITDIFEFERKKHFGSPEESQYLTIRISPLMDQNNEAVGRVIDWRDSTKRRRVEEARQKAREEMFVLLNAISSVAREATSLDDFLNEAIYQIVYPFHSQVVVVFLEDKRELQDQEKHYYLASHFGLHPDSLNKVLNISKSSSLLGPALADQQPYLFDGTGTDSHIPAEFQHIGLACILVVPLITRIGDENTVLGCMCLAKKNNPVYSADEIIRLTALCDHVASLIDNDRRRTLAISMSERKGLMRDLHDSVSQKLYGLVTLTEAAQAALETGNTIDPAQVLFRIGENARQAVKEMRLVLYQMQPIDLEHDGLASAIHHRLASVEGRADIKARLLADEHISLSKDKVTALYFIAQEALNNILRHAHAKTISVKLKQGRKNVILEIVDDGCGFDPKKLDRAGLGLVNMKERTLKMNGKITIHSKPGQGTKIVVNVPRDMLMQ